MLPAAAGDCNAVSKRYAGLAPTFPMLRPSLLLVSLLPLSLACSSTTVVGDPDAGAMISFDLGPPDTGIDLGPDMGVDDVVVGRACTTDDECGEGLECLEEPSLLPGGYCSAFCSGADECGEGALCVLVGRGTAICARACDVGVEDACPRTGYGCGDGESAPPVCLGGCEQASDCPDGLECNPEGLGSCFSPDARPGDACSRSEDCAARSFCLSEGDGGFPGGVCLSGFGCDTASNAGCSAEERCAELETTRGSVPVCFRRCAADSDCRAGYSCSEDGACIAACGAEDCSGGRVCNPAVGVCTAPFDSSDYGIICSAGRDPCAGGTCFSESETGFPDSACVYLGCEATPDGMDSCPGNGVCVDDGGLGFCVDRCVDDDGCRSGYTCQEQPSGRLGCVPACEDASVCSNDGFECNVGTGLCRPPFEAARFGRACAGPGECPGGLCIDEANDGFPGGFCAAVGCRLSGEGPASECPETGVCVDDGLGDPALGYCLSACTPDASGTCRDGYACAAEGDGGVCRPGDEEA